MKRKFVKKILVVMLCIAAVCFSLGLFAACGGNGGSGSGSGNGESGTGGGDKPSGEHTHTFVETVIEPTCTEKGYTLHKCACGYEFMDNLTAALGHNLGEWNVTTPATEEKDGEETRACTRDNCDYFESRKIPALNHTHDYITQIVLPDSIERIGGSAFNGCLNLQEIQLGNGLLTIGEKAFNECSRLDNLAIPSSVNKINKNAFSNCSKLIRYIKGVGYVDKWAIESDDLVTKVELKADTVGIADSAFSGCRSLTSITIPDSVTSIGDSAFPTL